MSRHPLPPSARPSERSLKECLITLSGTPDEDPATERCLIEIAELTAYLIDAVTCASIDGCPEDNCTASLSVPLFAGRGRPLAALDLRSQDAGGLAPLTASVLAAYEDDLPDTAAMIHDGLCPGAVELVEGLAGAFDVRAIIQQAIGMLIADEGTTADRAYALLRSRVTKPGSSLTSVAAGIVHPGRNLAECD
ncbi:ANTAR domain-containing protein [Actinoplanes friuliensis]|jgi:hypothetical protein|uniref:ANTAR domain-containing protein n=1 Tax=Actinoplanes friuliensis DSM 7358 TaxID=1246995 RepID=U5W3Q9_9ACTN|nr:ANTAR domain-containing protein [Actinoplanes friuliensis]AGZ43858.1 hypothetical protein AFR_27985 [Actinoplanes friuliensis DSM 7358]